MPKFEAHMTFAKDTRTVAILKPEPIADWYYSAIDDDPLMGQNPYVYLTGWDTDPKNLLDRMNRVKDILNSDEYAIRTLRTKVERIIYDSKTGVNELEPIILEGGLT